MIICTIYVLVSYIDLDLLCGRIGDETISLLVPCSGKLCIEERVCLIGVQAPIVLQVEAAWMISTSTLKAPVLRYDPSFSGHSDAKNSTQMTWERPGAGSVGPFHILRKDVAMEEAGGGGRGSSWRGTDTFVLFLSNIRQYHLLGNTTFELTEANLCLIRRVQCSSNGISIVRRKVKEHGENTHCHAFLSTLTRIGRSLLVHTINGTHKEIVRNNNSRSLEHLTMHNSVTSPRMEGGEPMNAMNRIVVVVAKTEPLGRSAGKIVGVEHHNLGILVNNVSSILNNILWLSQRNALLFGGRF